MADKSTYESLAQNIILSRAAQLFINEKIKLGNFKIPIHLALGHEVISESISAAMHAEDKLLCSHRNIHYHLAKKATISSLLDEFKLSDKGIAYGKGGSMNLANPNKSIVYTSSILGNNLCVGIGFSLAQVIQGIQAVTFIITGDGGMEEGSFYESIENARSFDLPIIIVVENNNWSLATQIEDRRKPIDLKMLASSLGSFYVNLKNNDPELYYSEISKIRSEVLKHRTPAIIEVNLTTLGGWTQETRDTGVMKYINYHAGAAPQIQGNESMILEHNSSDPLYLIKEKVGSKNFMGLVGLTRKYFHYL